MTRRVAEVRGWRAYGLDYCSSVPFDPIIKVCDPPLEDWVLRGLRGVHMHSNPAPPATCHPYFSMSYTREESGSQACKQAPDERCPDEYGCGYYGLFMPSLDALTTQQVIWVQVVALGPTLLCTLNNAAEGFRSERYTAVMMTWPRDMDGKLLGRGQSCAPYLPGQHRRPLAGRVPQLGEVLPALAERLGLELTDQSVTAFPHWGEWAYR